MCTFENEHSVLVCDVAIHQVREATRRAFGEAVQFTSAPGLGTRVEVELSVDTGVFQEVTREAIAVAQQKHATPGEVDPVSQERSWVAHPLS